MPRGEAELQFRLAQGGLDAFHGRTHARRAVAAVACGEGSQPVRAEHSQHRLPQPLLLRPQLRQFPPQAPTAPLCDGIAQLHEVAFAGIIAAHNHVDARHKGERLLLREHREALYHQSAYHARYLSISPPAWQLLIPQSPFFVADRYAPFCWCGFHASDIWLHTSHLLDSLPLAASPARDSMTA